MNILAILAIGVLVGWAATKVSDGLGLYTVNVPVGILGAALGNFLFAGSMGTSNALGVTLISALALVTVVQAIRNPPRRPGARKTW